MLLPSRLLPPLGRQFDFWLSLGPFPCGAGFQAPDVKSELSFSKTPSKTPSFSKHTRPRFHPMSQPANQTPSALLPTYARAAVAFVRGEGAWLEAEDGSRYLDFGAGIAVCALGHSHPKLVEALIEQGRQIFRYETFGDEAKWTDKLRMHEVVTTTVTPAILIASASATLAERAHETVERAFGDVEPQRLFGTILRPRLVHLLECRILCRFLFVQLERRFLRCLEDLRTRGAVLAPQVDIGPARRDRQWQPEFVGDLVEQRAGRRAGRLR